MDDAVSADSRALCRRIWDAAEQAVEDDRPYVAGQLLRMAQDLLGEDLWLVILEGLFMDRAQEILARHVAVDQARSAGERREDDA